MRVRKKTWAKHELETNEKIIRDAEAWRGRWQEYFNNDHPIYIEIGCGKGRFLQQNALAYPDINFVGVERDPTIVAAAARKLNETSANAALICGDAVNFASFFAPGEADRLYINFCDPWPKKKWVKRRLTYKDFLERYKVLMGPGAEIFMKTDNRILFDSSLNSFVENGWLLKNISLDLHNSGYEGNIMTEYEERFSGEGYPIYRLEARWYPEVEAAVRKARGEEAAKSPEKAPVLDESAKNAAE